jgi:hypothetical protein
MLTSSKYFFPTGYCNSGCKKEKEEMFQFVKVTIRDEK